MFSKALHKLIASYFKGGPILAFTSFDPAIQEAVREQQSVGTDMLLRGFLVRGWCRALTQIGVQKPEHTTKSIMLYIWDTIFASLWDTRNNILHRQKNKVEALEDLCLSEALVWYLKNKHEVILVYD